MKYLWLLLTILFVALIWYNSSLPAKESGELSMTITAFMSKLGNMVHLSYDGDLEHLIRKAAHFTEFAVLALLFCRTYTAFGVGNRTSTGYILFACLAVAVLDEYIQFFSPGRSCQVSDVLLDFSGSFCGWLCYRIWKY